MMQQERTVQVNGRTYGWPDRPLVVVCIDGSEPAYIEKAIANGRMPFLGRALQRGTTRLADAVVPSFTNPNNLSIVTGVPPRVHGICGNFFYDREADAEVMMNDPKFLRTETIFAAFAAAGARVAAVTAKDKLRLLLGHGLRFGPGGAICFSAEKADQTRCTTHGLDNALDWVGLPLPSVYSAELSAFVFAAGVKLMAEVRPDLLYLSTTDYVQHKHAPETEAAQAFYAMMDGYLAQLDALGATLALTADHGMNAKTDSDGNPAVIYLQSLLDSWFGAGTSRVILPITDPYVVHHGALGSFATIYLAEGLAVAPVLSRLAAYDGIACALSRREGCARFELPEDRMGDIIVVSTTHTVLGTRRDLHDLSGLTEPLRSHGGISEQRVPFLLTRPTPELPDERPLRNFDIFDVALNYVR
jgi:phosphonoacetate hydrolase